MQTSTKSMDPVKDQKHRATAPEPDDYPRGEGYLRFVGYLQIVAGVLTLLFSVFGVVLAIAIGEARWLNPFEVHDTYAGGESGVVVLKLIAAYVTLQLVLGWIFGLLLVFGGVFCLKPQNRRLVTTAAIVNLINFPHGTTVGILVLHGLARPGIAQAFEHE